MSFIFTPQQIEGLVIITRKNITDNRGSFAEIYKRSDFMTAGISEEFVQDNYSHSDSRVLRGLHYQKDPHAQSKIVTCLHGSILDVAVDLRPDSKTYGQYEKFILSEDECRMLYIPAGFAHGFVVLSDGADLLYKVSGEYAPGFEGGIIWNDADLNIDWEIDFAPVISKKDALLPKLRDLREGVI